MMTHKGTLELETERLILRRFEKKDAQNMFENWASNPNVTKFLTWSPHSDIKATKKIIKSWRKGYKDNDYYQWAIEVKEIDAPIGSISVVRINERINELEIGYCIGEPWWGKGYTAEAFKRIIAYFFEEIGAKRICAKHDTENPNSGRVMQKSGLTYEGTLRKAGRNVTNAVCDLAIYSILNY